MALAVGPAGDVGDAPGRREKGLEMGKWRLKYFSRCRVFCRQERLCVITAGNVKVSELSLEEPELQHCFVHRRTCSSKVYATPSGAVFVLSFFVIDLRSVNGNTCFIKKVGSRKAVLAWVLR